MSFDADWLALREPFDHAARSEALASRLAEHLAGVEGDLRLVELAGGTGSGVRWLGPRLPAPQRWWLVDHDPALLAMIPAELASPVEHDLRALGELSVQSDAVTCQALLDLVDLGFLETLARWAAVDQGGVPVLAALTVDGRVMWAPGHPADDEVQAAFRRHQLGDRGFGASVGPYAASIFADELRVHGYRVHLAQADWRVAATEEALLSEMVRGIAFAASQTHPRPSQVAAWRGARQAQVARGELSLMVGHLDLLGLPPGPKVR